MAAVVLRSEIGTPLSTFDVDLLGILTALVLVDASAPLGWDRYAGAGGEIIAMRSFGASAPIADVEIKFGFTVERVYAVACLELDARHGAGGGPL